MERAHLVLAGALLVGCYPRVEVVVPEGSVGDTGASEGSDPTDRDEDDHPIAVSLAEPFDGSTAGGLSVTVEGGPFTSAATATIGGNTAAVTLVSETQLALTVPASTAAGLADIVVTDGEATGTRTEGFRYWEAHPDQASVLMNVTYIAVEDPEAFSEAGLPREDHLTAWVALVEPTEASPLDALAAGVGACGAGSLDVTPVSGPEAVSVRLLSGDRLAIEVDDDGIYRSDPHEDASWNADLYVGLHADAATYPQIITPVATAAEAFVLDTPEPPESLSADPLELSWSGGAGELVHVHLADEAAGTEVSCLLEDAGGVSLDDSDLADLGLSGSTAVVLTVTSLTRGDQQLSFDDSELRGLLGHGTTVLLELSP